MNGLLLIVTAPGGEFSRTECDCVSLTASDGENGDNGGSFGIMKGHIPAVAALEEGSSVTASSGGSIVASFRIGRGFASVKNDVVSVVCESAERLT